MKKKKCVECYWYEPSEDARQGNCLFNPPVPALQPVHMNPSIARPAGPPQVGIGTAGMIPPTMAHHRCHNWTVDPEKMN